MKLHLINLCKCKVIILIRLTDVDAVLRWQCFSLWFYPLLAGCLYLSTYNWVSLVYCRWYFRKIKRIEAEKKLLLPENEHGAFLIRDSESRHNDYSLSGKMLMKCLWTVTLTINLCAVRDGDTVKHYRIRQLDEGGFFIARRTTFRWVSHLKLSTVMFQYCKSLQNTSRTCWTLLKRLWRLMR